MTKLNETNLRLIATTGQEFSSFTFVIQTLRDAGINHALVLEPGNPRLQVFVLKGNVRKAKRALTIASTTKDDNALSKAHRFLYQDN